VFQSPALGFIGRLFVYLPRRWLLSPAWQDLSHLLGLLVLGERWRQVILQLFTLLLQEDFACERNGIFLFLL
jgi:hypothetical protein